MRWNSFWERDNQVTLKGGGKARQRVQTVPRTPLFLAREMTD
jgi:hypothetical protein